MLQCPTWGYYGLLLSLVDEIPFAKQLNTAQESVKQVIPIGPKWIKMKELRKFQSELGHNPGETSGFSWWVDRFFF